MYKKSFNDTQNASVDNRIIGDLNSIQVFVCYAQSFEFQAVQCTLTVHYSVHNEASFYQQLLFIFVHCSCNCICTFYSTSSTLQITVCM